ncbi:hypothetical protein SASPL_109441 [Salvia splendens]|uniref:DUF7906 domain-containing protein n=1 Tax=Salvia splendens TaxID=180675 RepID=A0A8X8YIK9_SALSN|nr:hypothetical protein SASPL_109441 [Salvia splendens]
MHFFHSLLFNTVDIYSSGVDIHPNGDLTESMTDRGLDPPSPSSSNNFSSTLSTCSICNSKKGPICEPDSCPLGGASGGRGWVCSSPTWRSVSSKKDSNLAIEARGARCERHPWKRVSAAVATTSQEGCVVVGRDLDHKSTLFRSHKAAGSDLAGGVEVCVVLASPSRKGVVAAAVVCDVCRIEGSGESAPQAYRRDPGHPTWHHGAFHDVKDSVRSDVRQMLHSRAEVPFQVPLEVNVVLIGFNGNGGYRYTVDSQKLEEFLRVAFPSHRPSCLETGQPLDIEHHVVFNAFPVGQPELIALEEAVKGAMTPAGTAREVDFGREVPLFEVEATAVEPEFEKLYSYLFDLENGGFPVEETDRPRPTAIFVVNFDKVRIDPRNSKLDLDSLMYGKIPHLNEEELKNQEGGYIYRYRYNGGGASQIWLGSGRYVVVDLSAGPCTFGKIETEEGTVNSRTLPRLQNVLFPSPGASGESSPDIFVGKLASVIATIVEHVIAPDVRYEIVDMTTRLLVPIIVLQNHNRYNIMVKGHNYSVDVEAIEAEVKKMVHQGQDVVIVGGTHALHRHEKLAIAVSKAMRGHSLQETKTDGRFHVHTKTYLDGAILKEEMERSADVLAAGLLIFVLSLADVDDNLMMEDESLVWTSNDVVIVLEHQTDKIPLSAPYEKASHIHSRPVVNWLVTAGCHPFGPFSNTSQLSQLLRDVALRNAVYARVDAALHRIRETSENKSSTDLWLEKFYKKKTNLPEPFPHELVERLEKYLDVSILHFWYKYHDHHNTTHFPNVLLSSELEEQLVDLSSLLYDHRLQDANMNSSEILQSSMFTQQYVDHVLSSEREKMKCCSIEYRLPTHYSQNYIYAGILLAGFFVYFAVIFFASPVR